VPWRKAGFWIPVIAAVLVGAVSAVWLSVDLSTKAGERARRDAEIVAEARQDTLIVVYAGVDSAVAAALEQQARDISELRRVVRANKQENEEQQRALQQVNEAMAAQARAIRRND